MKDDWERKSHWRQWWRQMRSQIVMRVSREQRKWRAENRESKEQRKQWCENELSKEQRTERVKSRENSNVKMSNHCKDECCKSEWLLQR